MNAPPVADATFAAPGSPSPPRRRFRFRLRHFLVLFVALSIPLASWLNSARRQRDAITAIHRAGGMTYYDFQSDLLRTGQKPPPTPAWLISALGRIGVDCFHDVVFADLMSVHYDGRTVPPNWASALPVESNDLDSVVKTLAALPRLKTLQIDGLQFTDEQLEIIIRQHPDLENLRLNASVRFVCDDIQVNSASISPKRRICSENSFSNAGLVHLKRLKSLRHITIDSAHLDDETLRIVASMPSIEVIHLSGGPFTDAGLDHIPEHGAIQALSLEPAAPRTTEGPPSITPGGEARLFRRMPKLQLMIAPLPPDPAPAP